MVLRNTLLFLLATPLMLFSQQLPLNIQGQSPSFYLNHTVGAKENYYSIGRLYNVSPSINIAPFNNLKMEDGLKIGQYIMIPLVATNFSQDGTKVSDEVLVPIYYLTNTLYIPSYATLVGAGSDKTIIEYTGVGPAIQFINDDSVFLTLRILSLNKG
jgi:hypothetical protein